MSMLYEASLLDQTNMKYYKLLLGLKNISKSCYFLSTLH